MSFYVTGRRKPWSRFQGKHASVSFASLTTKRSLRALVGIWTFLVVALVAPSACSLHPQLGEKIEVQLSKICASDPPKGTLDQRVNDTSLIRSNEDPYQYHLVPNSGDCYFSFRDYDLSPNFGPTLLPRIISPHIESRSMQIDGRRIPNFGSGEFMRSYALDYLEACSNLQIDRSECIGKLEMEASMSFTLRVSFPNPSADFPRELVVIGGNVYDGLEQLG